MPEAVGWRWAVVVFMSVFLMSSSWDLEIALSGASAKVKPPNRLFEPGRKCVETSDDVIEDDFTSTLDSRIWDFSPMRLGAAKKARESAKSPDEFEAHPASSLFSWTKIRQSIRLKIAQAFGRARFAFWIQAAMSIRGDDAGTSTSRASWSVF